MRITRDFRALRGSDIVCFSNDWTGDPLSKMHLMRILSKENRILWIESLGNRAPKASLQDARRIGRKLSAAVSTLKAPREVEPNLWVLSPLALPAWESRLAADLNRRWLGFQIERAMARLSFKAPHVWCFLPSAAWVATSLRRRLLIYHCVDEFSEFTGAPQSLLEQEARLASAADLVIVSSERLLERKRPLNPRIALVRHGVDHAHFAQALSPELDIAPELARLPGPKLGFFGLIEDWIDAELLEAVARAFPGGSLVLLGREKASFPRLKSLPNVHFLGGRPYASLPSFCKGFDVALMPFRINELTLNSNPLKVREYLAAGLPVVSTAIPEIEALGQCAIGRDTQSFIEAIQRALKNPGPSKKRSEAVRDQSWEGRVEELRLLVGNAEAQTGA
ncbi:MAG: glycosyltransferase, partial [Myxococcales bacterium]|nr:glycosyltransferase [Myxococcales bacterium]